METIYELVAKITADSSELQKALQDSDKAIQKTGKSLDKETKDWKKSFTSVGKTFAVAGAAITVAMGGIIKSFVGAGSELHDLSQSTGLSIKALAGLKYAAEQNGASLGSVQTAVRMLANVISDASDGLEIAERAFKKLNISVKDLKSLTPEEQFLKVASAIAEIPDPMQRSALAVDMFGRSGTALLPMLSQGAEGLKKMTEEGIKLSGWTTEGANLADALGDSFTTLKTAMGGTFNVIASSLAPAVKNLAEKITNIVSKVAEWTKQHPELTKALSVTTTVFGGFLTIGGSLLLLIPRIILGMTALRAAFIAAQASMGPVGMAFAAISLALSLLIPILIGLDDKTGSASEAMGKLGGAVSDSITPTKNLDNKVLELVEDTNNLTDATKQSGQSVLQKMMADNQAKRAAEDNARAIEKQIAESKKLEWITNAITKASENQTKIAQKNHNIAMDILDAEYKSKLKNLGLSENDEIKALQAQIDALNESTEVEQETIDDANFEKEKANLKNLMLMAEDDEDYLRLSEQLAELESDHKRTLLLRERSDKIDALQEEISKVRDSYAIKKEELQNWYETEQTTLNTALETELARIDEVTKAMEYAYGIREKETEEHIKELNRITAMLQDRTITITTVQQAISMGAFENLTPGPGLGGLTSPYPSEQGGLFSPYAEGGIVNKPTLALVGEGGEREAIIPEHDWGNMGGVTLNFTQPIFFEREDQMDSFVDKIYRVIQRKQRLNYGNAYSG